MVWLVMNRRVKIIITVVIALLAGVLMYYSTPPDWPTSGVLKLHYHVKTTTGLVRGEFSLPISAHGYSKTYSVNGYNVTIYYDAPPRFKPGEKITVKIRVYGGEAGNAPSLTGSYITMFLPDNRSYTFYPTGKENNDTLVFRVQPLIHARLAAFIFGSAIVLFAAASFIHYIITGLYVTLALVLTGIQPGKSAYIFYMKPLIMVFIAGSGIELVIRKWGLDEKIANTLSSIARSPAMLIIGVSLLGSFLSMWMSNTAATYVMLPLATALVCRRGLEKCGRLGSIVMVSLAMGASIGGTATLIGTPPNLIAAGFLNDIVYGYEEINFYKWLLIGLPAWFIGYSIGVVLAIIYARLAAPEEWRIASEYLKKKPTVKTGRLSGKQWLAVTAILFLVALWITEPIHHISTGVAAGLGLLVFFAAGLLDPGKDWKKLSWDLMVLFGAGLTLGSSLMNTGWADYLLGLLSGAEKLGWLSLLLISYTAYLVGTFISSHTSASAFIAPLTIPLGTLIGPALGLTPETGAALTTIVAVVSLNNAIALPISTPPSAIVYASGRTRLRDLTLYGLLFGLTANTLIVLLLAHYWASIL